MTTSIFRRLYEWATRSPVPVCQVEGLGELVLEEQAWSCSLDSPQGPIRLWIGGRYEPAPELIASGQALQVRIAEFLEQLANHLDDVVSQLDTVGDSFDQYIALEIKSLKVREISLTRPRCPSQGIVFFDGPDDTRLWRLDFDGDRFSALGCDT